MDKNSLLIELSESDRTDFGRVDFATQSDPQKVFSAIWELEGQVNNGGFAQYFRNSDSDLIAYAPAALRTVGAFACQRIVERALEVVSPLPATQDGRYEALDELGEDGQDVLDALDREFFEYPDDLTELLFDFVCHRPDVFGLLRDPPT